MKRGRKEKQRKAFRSDKTNEGEIKIVPKKFKTNKKSNSRNKTNFFFVQVTLPCLVLNFA